MKAIVNGFVKAIRAAEFSTEQDRATAALILGDAMAAQFPRFDREMFLLACGVELEEAEEAIEEE